MYQTVHGSAGLLIGAAIPNPVAAFFVGFISHFILDTPPHDSIESKEWKDKGNLTKKFALEAGVDLLIFLGILWLLKANNLLVLSAGTEAGIIGAILPDYLWGIPDFLKIENKTVTWFKLWHNKLHTIIYKQIYIPLKYAIVVQLSFLAAILYLYLKVIT
jgi:hypothetical protein